MCAINILHTTYVDYISRRAISVGGEYSREDDHGATRDEASR
jgi:hypothetical protein